MEVEEEPEVEAKIGLSGEALRPMSMGTTFTQINLFSVWVY